MLVRTARRAQRRPPSPALSVAFAQLNLPWLAPALLRWHAAHTWLRHPEPDRSRRRSAASLPSSHSRTRQLATATEPSTPRHFAAHPPLGYSSAFKNPNHDTNVPWDLSRPGSGTGQIAGLPPMLDPVILDESLTTAPARFKISNGAVGTSAELLQHLHTSLRVGRVSRAQDILQRLAAQSPSTLPALRYAHTLFLRHSYNAIAALPAASSAAQVRMKNMQRWFEVELRRKGLRPDTKMLVAMIRASHRALEESQRDRAIRRYLEIARAIDETLFEDVLGSEEYDDEERFTVARNSSRAVNPAHPEASHKETAFHDGLVRDDPVAEESRQEHVPLFLERSDIVPLDTLPDVLPTEQKGVGLSGVKRAMDAIINLPALPPNSSREARVARAHERQRVLEETSVEIAIERWRQADEDLRKIGIKTAMQSKPVGALTWQWYQALLAALRHELVEIKKMGNDTGNPTETERFIYGPYLELLSLERTAALTILTVVSSLSSFKNRKVDRYENEMSLASLTERLGKAIEEEYTAQNRKVVRKKSRESNRAMRAIASRLKDKKHLTSDPDALLDLSDEQLLSNMAWPLDVRVKLSGLMLSKLVETAQLPVTREHPRTREKVTCMQPAFVYRIKFERGNRKGVLSLNPALVEKLESEPVGSLIAKRMPMIVPPKPWTGWNQGGYLHYRSEIMRLSKGDRSGKLYFQAAHRNRDVDQVLSGLNALGQVPWKVHQDVFKVQLEAWNSGEAIANFAPLNLDDEVPLKPEDGSDPVARKRWLQELRLWQHKRTGTHSQRCFQNFQLEVARGALNDILYFPHNMDFRGRAYPIPPYLNHMGADNVRGLLVFAEGKPLGAKGLRWLKIHLATVSGNDKSSMEDRVKFTEEHLDEIYDSVRDPLGGRRWWLNAEDAWQTLAACFELTSALDSPNPAQFISHLPIQQDGTCNGLQHYAALGGDEAGARQVNLEPGERPSDIYSAVAVRVQEEVARDAAAGDAVAQMLEGKITRKCVKQTVMTNVYGVTFFGATAQVRKQLTTMFPDHSRSAPVSMGAMATYVATKIFRSLGEMFRGAQAIQTWLGQCADRISTGVTPDQIRRLTTQLPEKTDVVASQAKTKETQKKGPKRVAQQNRKKQSLAKEPLFKSPVVWTTPLGLPVVQPYRKAGTREVKTSIQSMRVADPQAWDPVSKKKQLQGFPPNFIHSLDSTHMLLSAAKCTAEGLTFASIHDSFWTHACDVDRMSEVLRDAFIEVHSDDVVGRLREEFTMRYQDCMYLAAVVPNSETRKAIRELREKLKISANSADELAMEVERVKLLKSEDSDDRARGEAMVTPGSLLASMAREQEVLLAGSETVHQPTLGQLPGDVSTQETQADVEAEPVSKLDEADAEEALSEEDEMAADEERDTQTLPRKKGKPLQPSQKLFIWKPLEFPHVPSKGSFDVRRLRASKYFFS